MPDPRIRLFKAVEWQRYRDIRLRALKDSPDAFGSTYATSIAYPDERWQQRLATVDPALDLPMAAEVAGTLVGLGWGSIEPPDTARAHLYQMWVAPDHRGTGLGRALVVTAIAWARTAGASIMELQVTAGERPARQLYDALGFVVTGKPKPIRDGSDLLEETMELALSR